MLNTSYSQQFKQDKVQVFPLPPHHLPVPNLLPIGKKKSHAIQLYLSLSFIIPWAAHDLAHLERSNTLLPTLLIQFG